ncbi:unnamed protein product [Knipowitschia caucasica]|uniref:LINE-1 type transposase domain-containing 1 n=1 Tax=Knipowitschia caucasica TaxID=637954 RepID=A0AAV2MGU4_KNICA
MNQLIPQLLGEDNFDTAVPIERAHRSPTTARGSDTKPRTFLVKFLNFQDKIRILQLAREKQNLLYKGSKIHIFPDFSVALEKKRREFGDVKKKLRDLGIKYSMQYPCSLRITEDGKPRLFSCPAEVEDYVRHR